MALKTAAELRSQSLINPRYKTHYKHDVKDENGNLVTKTDSVGIGRHVDDATAFAFAQRTMNPQGQRIKSVSIHENQ